MAAPNAADFQVIFSRHACLHFSKDLEQNAIIESRPASEIAPQIIVSITHLPSELIFYIFSFLSIKDLCSGKNCFQITALSSFV
jgi:hypothetical protein